MDLGKGMILGGSWGGRLIRRITGDIMWLVKDMNLSPPDPPSRRTTKKVWFRYCSQSVTAG